MNKIHMEEIICLILMQTNHNQVHKCQVHKSILFYEITLQVNILYNNI